MDSWTHHLETAFRIPRLELPWGKVFVPEAPLRLESVSGAYPFVRFEWHESQGQRSAALNLRPIGRAGMLVCLETEESAPHAIAAAVVRQHRQLFSRFFLDFVARNGGDYGVPLFSRLPALTVNHRPDFLPAEAIHDGYRKWIEWAETVGSSPWHEIEADVATKLGRPRYGRHVGTPPALFHVYFRLSYVEVEAYA